MTETIKLMKAHTSVRRFKEQALPPEDLTEILTAAQMASSWKNFQSYSVIVVRSQEKKDALYELVPQEAIRQSAVFPSLCRRFEPSRKGSTTPYGYIPTSRGGRTPHHFSRCGFGWTKCLACGRKLRLWWSDYRFGALQVC